MTEHTTPAPILVEELGPLARQFRSERSLTLREAAGELGASVSALSQAERGDAALYRLALRSANLHFDRLVAAGHYTAGHAEERIQIVGGMLAGLTKLRGPETDRRAALLRQAFLARGVQAERVDQYLCVRLADSTIAVDLPTMLVFAWRGRANASPNDPRGRKSAGFIVDIDDLADGLSAEAWALVVDRFAAALVAASAGGTLDLEHLREGVRRSSPSGTPAAAVASHPPVAPMEK